MISIRVFFENGDSLETSINLDLDGAKKYYVGQYFELYDDTKPSVKAVAVYPLCEFNAFERAIMLGRCNVTAYYIYKHLQRGDLQAAQLEYQHDGDKLSKDYAKCIVALLGCRMHLVKDCQKKPCS